jgi:hypothetical protein
VTKRHQTNRRKSFSRRQHELRERPDRRTSTELYGAGWDHRPTGSDGDSMSFLDTRSSGIRFALGD